MNEDEKKNPCVGEVSLTESLSSPADQTTGNVSIIKGEKGERTESMSKTSLSGTIDFPSEPAPISINLKQPTLKSDVKGEIKRE